MSYLEHYLGQSNSNEQTNPELALHAEQFPSSLPGAPRATVEAGISTVPAAGGVSTLMADTTKAASTQAASTRADAYAKADAYPKADASPVRHAGGRLSPHPAAALDSPDLESPAKSAQRRVSLQLSASLHRQVKLVALEEEETLNSLVVRLLRRYVQERNQALEAQQRQRRRLGH